MWCILFILFNNETLFSVKKDSLPFVTIWMDLDGITLSEIRQRKTNTMWSHLHVKSKKPNKTKWKQSMIVQMKILKSDLQASLAAQG